MAFSPDDPVIPVGFAAPAAEQILVMHCLREDSLLGREGFSVRAASNRESPLLEWALAIDHYELPLDLKSRTLLLNQTPRRLALVPTSDGRVALVHSAYLAEDTCHRPHSFVSHILIYPRLDMLQAAASWGSPDWQTDEYERGATQLLPPFNGVPHADLINDAALTAFLEGSDASADQSLARVVFPSRVDRKPESRRRWLRAVLHAFLRTGEPNPTRPRVCILAEPGVVALLVYAIARLLPSRLVGVFPFSTYEPPHTSFRENKIARVVGSYARDGLSRADNTLRRRAYVIDTIQDDCGPELMVESSWPLEGLVKLAAAGDWSKIDELRELWAADTRVMPGVTPAALAETLRVQPLVAELRNGVLKVEGLSELRRTRLGEGLLRRSDLRSRAWEVVRQVWTRPEVQKEFADLLGEHLDELFADLHCRIESSQDEAWRADWDAFELLVPVERRVEYLTRLLESLGTTAGARTLPVTERVEWLHRWSRAAPSASAVPTGLFWLLQTGDESTFRTLIGSSKCEPRHAGLAACLAFAGWADGRSVLGILKQLSDDQFREFVTQLERFRDRDSVFAKVVSDSDLSRALVGQLIRTPLQVSPDWFEGLLSATRCDDSNWHKYWLKEKRLEGLLERLGISSALSRHLWDGLVARITPDNFDDCTLSPELETLCAAARRFPATLSPEQQKRLIGWETLSNHFASPQNSPETRTKLLAACEAVGQDFDSLAERWLHNHVDASHDDLDQKRHDERLARVLRGFHEDEESTCAVALKLAQTVRDPNLRRLSTEDLFRAIVSKPNWNRLVQRHHREINGTSIAPLSLSRSKGQAGVKTGKRLSLGRRRLPPELSRIADSISKRLRIHSSTPAGFVVREDWRPADTLGEKLTCRAEKGVSCPGPKTDLGELRKQSDKERYLRSIRTSSKAPRNILRGTADPTPNKLETTTAGREPTVYPPGPQPGDAKEPARANARAVHRPS